MSPGVSTRLVQLLHPYEGRRAALVHENKLHLLATHRSVYSFAVAALETGWKLRDLLSADLSGVELNYDEVHALATLWRFLPSFDHPDEPGRCLVSAAGPPWRYIGSGASLRGHGEELAAAGADVAAIYVIGPGGAPRRIGITPGITSRKHGHVNSIGPELILDPAPSKLEAMVRIERASREVSARAVSMHSASLEAALTSMEPDHFESADFRNPGDTHIHFFGERLRGTDEAAVLDGDEMVVEFRDLGRALRNKVRMEQRAAYRVAAVPL